MIADNPSLGGDPLGESYEPIILDLDGDGIELMELGSSTKFFDIAGDGYKHRTAWAAGGDGVLAIDADGDGVIDQQKEIVFTEWDPTATSDMQALRNVFDTNHNGQLDAGDDRFADFKVVVQQVDGSTSVRTLAQAGIASINLTEDKTSRVFSDGSSIDGQTTYTKTNGTIRAAATVTLAADADGHAVRQTRADNPDGSTTFTYKMLAPDGSVASETVSTTSADGLTRTMTFDDDGDGVVDRAQSDVTVVNGDNSRTRTVSNTDQTGVLLDRTTTTTSADKKSVTIERDPNGNGVVDQREERLTNADNSQTVTITELRPNGWARSKSVSTVSADGQTRTTTLDIDGDKIVKGDGTVDMTRVDATVTAGDGTRTRTVSETNADGSLRDRTQTISSADGSAQTVRIDSNGDGVYERVRTSTIVRNTNGSTTTTDTDKSANGGLIATRVTTTSADGLSVTTVQDLDGDGDTDLTTVDDTQVYANSRVQTITETDGSGGLLRKTTITKGAANGLSGSIKVDTDGDGNDDQIENISVDSVTGDVTDAKTIYSPDRTVQVSRTVTKTTENGLKRTISFDYNGDNANDLITEVATVKNADGSSTVTTSDKDRNNILIDKVETTTSADGLTITTKSDVDGDGTYEFTTVKATVVAANNSITTTETTKSENNTKQSGRSTYINPTRTSTTIRDDLDGDGNNDRVDAIVKQNDGSTVQTLSTHSRNATLTSRTVTTTSADDLSVTIAADVDGNGTTDLTTTDVTVLNADGSRTQTVSVLGPTNALRRKLTTTRSASGLSTTILEDLDGNGTTDLTTTDVTTILNSGYRQEDITSKAGTKVVGTKSILTSRSGLSVTTQTDADGDGDIDTKTTDVTTLGVDGSKTRTVTNTNLDLTMRSRTQTVTSRDGRSVTTSNNLDGSGSWDRIEAIVEQADGKLVRTIAGYDLGTGIKNYGFSQTTSADGLSWTRSIDENGDGVNDETETLSLTYNADGSTRQTYTDMNWSWNAPTGEYGNFITKYIDTSADGLSKTITVSGLNQSESIRNTVEYNTDIKIDGGTEQTVRVTYFTNTWEYQSLRRITTDAHGFSRRDELEIGTDGRYKESTENIINIDGSSTNSYNYRVIYSAYDITNYRRVVDVSADGLTVSTKSTSAFGADFDLFEMDQKLSDGSTIKTIQYKDPAGIVKDAMTETISFDGRTTTVLYDTDGNGATDRTEQTVTVINANGSTTTTRSEYNRAGSLRNQIASTTSANGLSIAATIDLDGDGVVDETFSDVTNLKDDGSTSRVVKTLYDDGSKKNQTWITTTADGLSRTTRQDIDGDGNYDFVTVEDKYSSGMTVVTVSRYNASGGLIYKDKTTTSANGRIVRRERDADGNGIIDTKNVFHAVAGQDGSYDATLQDFMNSGVVRVNHFIDENGVDWFKYNVNGSWSQILAGTSKALAVQDKMRADIYDVILDRDMADVEGNIPPIGMTFSSIILSLINGTEFYQRYGAQTNAQFIEQMHANAYNRGATLSELKSWLTPLSTGGALAKQNLVWELAHSAEHTAIGNLHRVTSNTFNITGLFVRDRTTDKAEAKIIVDRLYVTAVAHHITGTNSNIPLILSGSKTEAQIATDLIGSSEFQALYGTLSNQDFVAQMFQNGLGRAATNAEKTSWATLLGNGTISRADFVVAIANSPDYQPGSGVSAAGAMASAASSGNTNVLAAAGDVTVAANPLAMSAAPPVPAGAFVDDRASMLRLVQAMASMTPQSASETTLPFAAIPVPQHQLASPLH